MHFIQPFLNRISTPNTPSRVRMLPLLLLIVMASACSTHTEANQSPANMNSSEQTQEEQVSDHITAEPENHTIEEHNAAANSPDDSDAAADADASEDPSGTPDEADRESAGNEDEEQDHAAEDLSVIRDQYDITDPESIAVLVNKTYGLSESFEPNDLVKVEIPFVYQDESVHSLRQVAADAIIDMFEASKEDGIELAGVSGYRSHAIQRMLYDKYVARDGEEAANKYSAKPGHSEHSTGLAMDVAGISGKCAANNCFAGTEEALWLADHAHEFGFIIRYPLGKEEITGYQYEPWHLRYVGEELSHILYENEWTMEEFFLESNEANPI